MKQRYLWNTDGEGPRDYDDVLVTVSNDEVVPPERVVVQAYFINGSYYDATFNNELTDVVAWLPAPQPYEEDIQYERREDNRKSSKRGTGRDRVRDNESVDFQNGDGRRKGRHRNKKNPGADRNNGGRSGAKHDAAERTRRDK